MATKCGLCGRKVGKYVESIQRIEFDGNDFDVCEGCETYLLSEVEEINNETTNII